MPESLPMVESPEPVTPDASPPQPLQKKPSPLRLVVLLTILLALSGLLYISVKQKTVLQTVLEALPGLPTKETKIAPGASVQVSTAATVTPTYKPTPTPIILQPDTGTKGTYNISQGAHAGPTFQQVIFDPLDVQKGQTLTITVIVTANSNSQSVTGTLQTDSGKKNLTFQKTQTTAASEFWSASVTVDSTVWYTYILTINATSAEGASSATVAPRS